jgi:hypothetical protein
VLGAGMRGGTEGSACVWTRSLAIAIEHAEVGLGDQRALPATERMATLGKG